MKRANFQKAFTLVELMIVVAVIAIISAAALPAFTRSRATALQNVCVENLKHIRASVDMWALDTNAAVGQTPRESDLVPAYIKAWPQCKGVSYEIPAVGSDPVCPNAIAGHDINTAGQGSVTPSPRRLSIPPITT